MLSIYPILNIDNKEQLREVVNRLVTQVSDVGMQLTLTGGTTETIFKSPKISSLTKVTLTPRNIEAMNTKYFIKDISNGQFVLSHDAANGQIYDVVLTGVL
ncbi:hypothetical protein G6M86_20965 [Agrobacterium tumefaciens]|uniref:Uncharacterized protein n=1 Tax=Agrobacterium tumefaciens TaxID=358 RepID=A0AAJ4TC59_AGRTU|nr:hypothetical protein G6M86_20965 [Agrobacterium tumefaciens]